MEEGVSVGRGVDVGVDVGVGVGVQDLASLYAYECTWL
jgi:hypothetical protein